ncbi:extended synaptotagmin-2 [Melanaphis sacchari]|nr:extended synaptotagmin-2 [Melanaphis sacchari]XP_025204675.1 extended synaptotagmin-2 [Melanaphis sacchari]XP_025204677.1 extended synaptotagmin-2 [Melanaphis sacchari]
MADRQGDDLRLLDDGNNSSALVGEAEVADNTLDKPTVRQTVWRVTKGLVPVVSIYALGFWRVASVSAWVLVPFFFCLSVVRDLLRNSGQIKRRRAQLAAAANEKDLITANFTELPSWVFFPDIHRAEWLNQIIKQMWPMISVYAQTTIKNTVEPMVIESLREYKINNFAFDKLRLGSIPPKIGGVKVYDKVSRDQIMLDIDVIFASDSDISFFVSGIPCGIKDFQIRGMMRVIMKPLLTTSPLVGGMQIFFLHQPDIDYDLMGVADVLDMPGLNDILKKVIAQQVAALMVLPNKLPIVLSNEIAAHVVKLPEPEGVLRVHIFQAKNLVAKDMSLIRKGKSDPYVIITLGSQQYKTHTINNELNPKWDYWCEFASFSPRGQVLKLKLYDEDEMVGKKHSNLGRASIQIGNVAKNGYFDKWINLEDTKHGMIHVRMIWLDLTLEQSALKRALTETQELRITNLSSAVLMVYIDSAINLPNARAQSKPDPLVRVTVGQTTQATVGKLRTERPVYEQGFTFLVSNPETDTIEFKVIDQKTNTQLGLYVYELSSLLLAQNMRVDTQPYDLIIDSKNQQHDSKILFCMQLKFLKKLPLLVDVSDDAASVTKPLSRQSSVQSTKSINSVITSADISEIQSSAVAVNTPTDGMSRTSSIKRDSTISRISHAGGGDQEPLVEQAETTELSTEPEEPAPGTGILGSIQITLMFSVARQRLNVTIHKVVNLPIKEPSDIPDPYVKLYVLPKKENSNTKRKTETYKDNCNPVYEETFEYIMGVAELNSKQLEVTVLTKKTWHSPVLGQIVLNISDYVNINTPSFTGWFDLEAEIKEGTG